MSLLDIWHWILVNWIVVLAVVAWVITNVVPRPHPENLTGWQKTVWTIIDRICVLTASDVPGNLKWIFAPSPSPTGTASGKLPPIAPPPPKE